MASYGGQASDGMRAARLGKVKIFRDCIAMLCLKSETKVELDWI